MRREMTLLALFAVAVFSTACSLDVQMQHEPVIATSNDEITFTAETVTKGSPLQNLNIDMFVNGALVKTCNTTPCVYTGGPYPALENDWLGYHAEVTVQIGQGLFQGNYHDTDLGYTGIAEVDYSWKEAQGAWHIPARWGDWTWNNTNVLIQRSTDYAAAGGLVAFLGDVGDKMIDVLMAKEEIWGNMVDINVYAYRKAGDHNGGSCGTLHADTIADTGAVIDDNAILHVSNIQDCTSGFNQFTAEGPTNTQAFLHEFSHSIFEQADEYDGPTFYFEAANEPNIFTTEAKCQNEQTAKSRDPADCFMFTALQGDWWGTQGPLTVMTNGLVTHPWSTESVERLRWWFDNN